MKSEVVTGSVVSLLALVLAGACGDDDHGPSEPSGGSAGERSGDTGGTAGRAGGGGSGQSKGGAPGTGGTGGDDSIGGASSSMAGGPDEGGTGGDGAGGDGGFCVVDFPCLGQRADCINSTQVQAVKDIDCHEVCGPGKCGGGACGPDGPIFDCPAGTQCRMVPVGTGSARTGVCTREDQGGEGGGTAVGDCGNGELNDVEQCDDGNLSSGDGCSQYCLVESGFICSEPGEACMSGTRDSACTTDACFAGDTCIEPNGLTCACPEDMPESCGDLAFRSLPTPEGFRSCVARGMSDDGLVVVGACNKLLPETSTSVNVAVLWRLGEGSSEIDAGEGFAQATAASEDASIIAGVNGELGVFRLVDDELETIADNGFVWDMTPDGSAMVGGNVSGAFEFNAEDGVVELEALTTNNAFARAINTDGSVIVGGVGDANNQMQAARWNAERELELLPIGVTNDGSEAVGVTSDGSWIAGTIWMGNTTQAVYWNDGDMVELEAGANSSAYGITDDLLIFGGDADGPFVWDPDNGHQNMVDLLTIKGAHLENWGPLTFAATSADGTVFVGNAQYLGADSTNHQPRPVVAWLR